MKVIKNKLLIFFVFIICLIPLTKVMAVEKDTPINVKWECKKDSCELEKHLANIRIKPIGNAPIGDDYYEIRGDGSVDFAPELDKAGKYEYLIYQENKNIKDGKTELIYDKRVYRLVYVVQEGAKGLKITVYAYDNDKYEKEPNDTGKIADIIFINKDIGKKGNKTDEPGNNKDKDSESERPEKPDNPNQSKNPNNPDKIKKPDKTRENKVNKISNDNVKTGVESLGGICIILLSATGTIFATRQKNK